MASVRLGAHGSWELAVYVLRVDGRRAPVPVHGPVLPRINPRQSGQPTHAADGRPDQQRPGQRAVSVVPANRHLSRTAAHARAGELTMTVSDALVALGFHSSGGDSGTRLVAVIGGQRYEILAVAQSKHDDARGRSVDVNIAPQPCEGCS